MEPARQTQAARSQATRDQIVQAALTVFALKGFAASSMDDICMAAGCSKGGLYHHFPTKLAVLSSVVERLSSQGALLPPFANGPLQPEVMGRVLVEIWAEASRDGGLRDQLRTAYARHLDAAMRLDDGLGDILRIGTLIQLLALSEFPDAGAAARRLGIAARAA
jgi:AcrR family transcriptional regulator